MLVIQFFLVNIIGIDMGKQQHDILVFGSPILLFGASPMAEPAVQMLRAFKSWPVIAADGGVETALDAGFLPQAIIGDMDSVDDLNLLPKSIHQIVLPQQDDTDFEKCLQLIDAPLIVGVGFLDGRFDHSLAVLDALARLQHDRPVFLVGANDVLLRIRGDFEVTVNVGARFSVWPLGCQHFLNSTGLEWALENMTMEMGQLSGTSNRANANKVSILAGNGDGYLAIAPLAEFDNMLQAALQLA